LPDAPPSLGILAANCLATAGGMIAVIRPGEFLGTPALDTAPPGHKTQSCPVTLPSWLVAMRRAPARSRSGTDNDWSPTAMKTIAAIVILAAAVCAAEPRVHRGLPYAEPGSELQTLDVYAPAEGKNLPVAVWIHGGGWHRGDKSDVEKKPQALLDKGFVFVSINYRLFPTVTIKEIAADVAKAIRWTSDHIREYGGDPRAIVVMGHSAGAQLAALVCTDDRYLKAEGIPLSAVKACVPVDGDSYDVPMQIKAVEEEPAASHTLTFGDPAKQKKLPSITLLAKGRRAASYRIKFGDEALQKELSAVTHVAKGKSIPPFLVLHVADHPETKAQSQRLVKALAEAGIPATAYPAAGKNHTTINADLGLPNDRPTQEIVTFLGAVLKRQ
jgi:acetyl esterase/lipase